MPLVSPPRHHMAGSPVRPAIVAVVHVTEVKRNHEEINFKGKH